MTPINHLHIVGAGMAGLSAAAHAVHTGAAQSITIHEATKHAGGRCRSYHDAQLDRTLDTGSHLILGAYGATFDFLTVIGAPDGLVPHPPASFAMHDINSGQTWSIRPGENPLWLFDPKRRTPNTGVWAHLRDVWRLRGAGADDTVGARLSRGDPTLMAHLWDPFVVAVMNTATAETSAPLLWRVLRETLLAGEAACRAYTAPNGLTAALVDPALAYLAANKVNIHFNSPVRGLDVTEDEVTALTFDDAPRLLDAHDQVILALPPKATGRLLPQVPRPTDENCILNAHFRLNHPVQLPGDAPFIGIIGGRAQWLFVRGDVLSVTVSVADDLADLAAEAVARTLWAEAAPIIGADPTAIPAHRVIREKAATMAHTPAQLAKRPGVATRYGNMHLAGDWTNTGLPATIEGAVRSGVAALESAARSRP